MLAAAPGLGLQSFDACGSAVPSTEVDQQPVAVFSALRKLAACVLGGVGSRTSWSGGAPCTINGNMHMIETNLAPAREQGLIRHFRPEMEARIGRASELLAA